MNAVQNLTEPDKRLADAVITRQEIDLRIGASFTRFQSINFKSILGLPSNIPVSYGPWQFPTLGFVVERYQRIRDFKPEKFWYLDMKYQCVKDGKSCSVTFNWKRKRIFDKIICLTLYERCLQYTDACITKATKERTTKIRPEPLNTINMQKLISRKLKMSSAKAMEIAEKLYNKGFISYPRTETTWYGSKFNLKKLAEKHKESHKWGDFAKKL